MVAVLANSLDTFNSMQNLATEIITAVTYNDELSEYTISHDLSQARYSEVATMDRPGVITAKKHSSGVDWFVVISSYERLP